MNLWNALFKPVHAFSMSVVLVLLLVLPAAGQVLTGPFTAIRTIDVANVKLYGAACNSVTDDTVALQAAINALSATDGGTVFIPQQCGKVKFTTTITPGRNVRIMSYGSPSDSNTTAPGLAYTGTGAGFSISGANDFILEGVSVTGGNPFVQVLDGSAFGRIYGVYRSNFTSCTAGIKVGNSNPFVRISDNIMSCSSYNIQLGQSTDAFIFSNYFQNTPTVSLAHINLLAGSNGVHIFHNRFIGTNTSTPDIQVNVGGTGGVGVTAVWIDDNQFGNENVNGADSRVKFVYDGVGGAVVTDLSISKNYVSNGVGGTGVPSFINFRDGTTPTAIQFSRVSVIANRTASGPGTGWYVNDSTNGSNSQNVFWGNTQSSASFTAPIRTGGTGWAWVGSTMNPASVDFNSVQGVTQFTSTGTFPTLGQGLELLGGAAPAVQCFNRGGGAWLDCTHAGLSHIFQISGAEKWRINSAGTVTWTPFTFATIGTALTANGQMGYCSDCTIANPCAGGGTGAIAKRLNAINVCN